MSTIQRAAKAAVAASGAGGAATAASRAGGAGPSGTSEDPRYFEFGEAGPSGVAQVAKKPKGRVVPVVYPAGSPGGTIDETHPGTIVYVWDDEADAYEGAEPNDDFPSYEDAARDARKGEKSRKRRGAGT